MVSRHHSTEAHKTSLTSVETDDVSLLFRHFDGFFLYGFIFAFDEEDLFEFFDPMFRDTSVRDFEWFENIWKNNSYEHNAPYIGKLFSLSANRLALSENSFPIYGALCSYELFFQMFSNHSKSLTLVSLNIGSKNSNKSSSSKAKINPYKKKPSKCLNKRLTSSVSTEVRLVLCASVEWCLDTIQLKHIKQV